MNAEEKSCWERRRLEARRALDEIAPTRKKLKELSEAYDRIFVRQFLKFSEADEKLAMEDGRYKLLKSASTKPRKQKDYTGEELLRMMSMDQILRLQAILTKETKGGEEQVSTSTETTRLVL